MIDKKVYRLKFYFENDYEGLSDAISEEPNKLFDNFDGHINWNVYKELYKKDMSTKEELQMAWSIYDKFIPEFYRIELINEKTQEVIDYIGKPIRYVEFYRFKFYFNDKTTVISSTKSKDPRHLFYDFDGLMEWDDYYDLYERDLTTHQVLELAMNIYKDTYKKDYYRIEIINDKTNEIIDFIEKKG